MHINVYPCYDRLQPYICESCGNDIIEKDGFTGVTLDLQKDPNKDEIRICQECAKYLHDNLGMLLP